MEKTTLLRDELEAVVLDALRQNPLTADISDVEIAIEGHDVERTIAERGRPACDWTVARARRGGGPFFDGAVDDPVATADHRVGADDSEVRRALDRVVWSLRARYAVTP